MSAAAAEHIRGRVQTGEQVVANVGGDPNEKQTKLSSTSSLQPLESTHTHTHTCKGTNEEVKWRAKRKVEQDEKMSWTTILGVESCYIPVKKSPSLSPPPPPQHEKVKG